MIKNKTLRIIFRLILVVCCTYGLCIQLGIVDGTFKLRMLNYFTVLSNIYVDAVFIILIINDLRNTKPISMKYKGLATLAISLTGLVAHFMLQHTFDGLGSTMALGMNLLHVVTPIMAVLDYFIFDEKGKLQKSFIIFWAIVPIIYVVYAMIASQFGDGIGAANGSRYPYPFLDIGANGIVKVLITILVMSLIYILVSYLYVIFDMFIGKKINGRN